MDIGWLWKSDLSQCLFHENQVCGGAIVSKNTRVSQSYDWKKTDCNEQIIMFFNISHLYDNDLSWCPQVLTLCVRYTHVNSVVELCCVPLAVRTSMLYCLLTWPAFYLRFWCCRRTGLEPKYLTIMVYALKECWLTDLNTGGNPSLLLYKKHALLLHRCLCCIMVR